MSIQVTVMSIDFDSFEEPITKVFRKDEITLGRTAANDLVLDRPEVSTVHARIRVRSNGGGSEPHLFVTDLGSSNGTMLEREGLAPDVEVPMQANQRIIIGTYLIKPSILAGDVERKESQDEPIDDTESAPVISADPVISAETMSTHSAISASALDAFTHAQREEVFVRSETAAPRAAINPGPTSVTVEVESEAVIDLNFEASALYTLSGKITHKGAAIAGVRIDGDHLGSTESAADGTFSFREIEEGAAYRLALSKAGYLFEPSVLTGNLERDTSVDFTARQLLKIGGRVVHKGKPLAGVEIECINLGKATTDMDGRYSFGNVPEGARYTIRALKPGFKLHHTRDR